MKFVLIALALAACSVPTDVRLHGPECPIPVPILTAGTPTDSLPLGCPYAIILDGDTIIREFR